MRDIDLKTLRLFVAVCDSRNMARAAEQEHIEPSAISKRIAQLEADLGTPLLLRARRGVHPTPAGEAVLEHARNVLFTMDRLTHDATTFGSGVTGHVRMIATASAIAESLLDDIASFMRAPANANIKVDIEERYSRDLVRLLREGTASVGVCWDTVELDGLHHLPYRRDRLALAVHPDHPLAARKSVRFEQTLDHEYVGLPPGAAMHTMLTRAAARTGRSVSYRVIVSNFDAAFRVVAANLAISIVPFEVGSPYAAMLGVKLIALSDAWARRRFIVCFQDLAGLPPAARRMVDHLVERAANVEVTAAP
jgi:DNA-binding transcriptional LysR family regulator